MNSADSEEDITECCLSILDNEFDTQYSIGDICDYIQFSEMFETKYNKKLEWSIENLDAFMKKYACKSTYGYCSYNYILSSDGVKKLFEYLEYNKKCNVLSLSLERIFEDLSDIFVFSGISEKNIQSIWSVINHYSDEYTYSNGAVTLCKKLDTTVNEVVKILVDADYPMSSFEIKNKIVSISNSEVDRILANSVKYGIVKIEKDLFVHSSYYPTDIVLFNLLKKVLDSTFNGECFSSKQVSIRYDDFYELCNRCAKDDNFLIDQYKISTPLALYNLLKVLLPEYYYNSLIIYPERPKNSKSDIMMQEFDSLDSFTSSDLDSIFNNYGYRQWVYLSLILQKFLRIDEEHFVSKNKMNFDIDLIDNFISKLVTNGYCLIKSILTYSNFPEMKKYHWNKYLLVSYIVCFSNHYKVVSYGDMPINFECIIVDKDRYISFEDVAAQYLIDSKYDLDASDSSVHVSEHLQKGGLIQRKSRNKFKNVWSKAKILRSNMNV